MQGIDLAFINLTGWSFSGQNLANASLSFGTLTNANLTGATVSGAYFYYSNLTAAQLYSTASYLAQNLQGIGLQGNDLTGWNFSGQNLTNANLSYATLTSSNLTGADLRGAQGASLDSTVATTNTILPDGTIQGLTQDSNNPTFLVRNYSGSSSIPIHILQGMSMNPGTSLLFQFDGNPWGSTISFASGIPVALGGNIELGLAPGTDPATLYGRSLQVFNWAGVSPTGQFGQVISVPLPTRYSWDTSNLYTLGTVNLTTSGSAINGQWTSNGSGTWSGSANWSGGNVPQAPEDTAVFGAVLIGGTATVSLNSIVNLASLVFSTTGGASYVISPSGASTLTLSSTAGPATISNSGGNNTIAVPITLESNLSVSASAGSVLTIAGAISESGSSCSLTLSGGGELILSGSNTYTGGTDVVGGTLVVASPTALADGTSLTVGANATSFFGASAASPSVVAVPEPGTLLLLVAATLECHGLSPLFFPAEGLWSAVLNL